MTQSISFPSSVVAYWQLAPNDNPGLHKMSRGFEVKTESHAILGKLEAQAKARRPKLIAIDPSADVFGGDEINRVQVSNFASMLRGLAIEHDGLVLLFKPVKPTRPNDRLRHVW
jgi:RecA-family ATPase